MWTKHNFVGYNSGQPFSHSYTSFLSHYQPLYRPRMESVPELLLSSGTRLSRSGERLLSTGIQMHTKCIVMSRTLALPVRSDVPVICCVTGTNLLFLLSLGNGVTDDTAAINRAIQDGGRCGQGCESSTVTPAVIYFPAGTYLITSPIVAMYYSQLVGDPLNVPTIKGAPNFSGIGLIDSDPYLAGGANWYQNQVSNPPIHGRENYLAVLSRGRTTFSDPSETSLSTLVPCLPMPVQVCIGRSPRQPP